MPALIGLLWSTPQAKVLDSVLTEMSLLRELDHPGVVKLYETWEDVASGHALIDLPWPDWSAVLAVALCPRSNWTAVAHHRT